MDPSRRSRGGAQRSPADPRRRSIVLYAAQLVAVSALAVLSCSRKAAPDVAPASSAPAPASAFAPVPSSEASAEAAAGEPDASAQESRDPPAGYEVMTVMDVVETSHGSAVLLVDRANENVVPIFVGGTEALSIALRLEGHKYQRPLTHDLLDSLVGRLGGDLFKVHVDDIRGSTFVGTVFVRQGPRVIDADARPSDAIALALGHKVPIFVARKVIDAGGVKKRDLEASPDGELHLPNRGQEPLSL